MGKRRKRKKATYPPALRLYNSKKKGNHFASYIKRAYGATPNETILVA
jgi:hypothetical protein